MTTLEKLRNLMVHHLAGARHKRQEALTRMNVADAEIEAYTNALNAIERELDTQKKTEAAKP